MKRFVYTLIILGFAKVQGYGQSFTMEDLLTLSSLSPGNAGHFMNKKRFSPVTNTDGYLKATSFFEEAKAKKKDTSATRSIDMYKKDNAWYFVFHTSSKNEFVSGQEQLIKSGFSYDNKKDIRRETSMLFQKRNITVKAFSDTIEENPQYTFVLEKKEIPGPASIRFAENLLCFDSHEYLVSFFGTANVKKDLYYFSDKQLKKCSVLFPNTSRQVLFVWDDENNLSDLSYILIGDVIPTVSAEKFNDVIINNKWELENGIHTGMSIKELLMLNEKDFEFYGNRSGLSFMIKPENNGKIDFKKATIMLSCSNCNNNPLFNQKLLNATEVAEENLPLYVHAIIISAEKK